MTKQGYRLKDELPAKEHLRKILAKARVKGWTASYVWKKFKIRPIKDGRVYVKANSFKKGAPKEGAVHGDTIIYKANKAGWSIKRL